MGAEVVYSTFGPFLYIWAVLSVSAFHTMQFLTLSILILLFSCNTSERGSDWKETSAVKIQQVANFDTLPNGQRLLDNMDSAFYYYYKEVVGTDTLKGGYVTCYGVDDSMNYFYLRHGDTLHLLNKREKIVGAKSLGTLEEDFDSFFISRIDNGNGVAETYQVFDKRSGKNLLGEGVEAWGFKCLGDALYFLYDNHTVNLIDNYYIDRKEADSIFLYNIKSDVRQGFKLPSKEPTGIIYYSIKALTGNSLTIGITEHYSGKEKLMNFSR